MVGTEQTEPTNMKITQQEIYIKLNEGGMMPGPVTEVANSNNPEQCDQRALR